MAASADRPVAGSTSRAPGHLRGGVAAGIDAATVLCAWAGATVLVASVALQIAWSIFGALVAMKAIGVAVALFVAAALLGALRDTLADGPMTGSSGAAMVVVGVTAVAVIPAAASPALAWAAPGALTGLTGVALVAQGAGRRRTARADEPSPH